MGLDEESEGRVVYGADGKNIRKFVEDLRCLPLLSWIQFRGTGGKVWNGPVLPDMDRFLADLSEYDMVGNVVDGGKGLLPLHV